ncbi:MAG TPA: thioredoxin domain-containing protein [Alphaproteobacteria bacterium]|nr:thioredoxin domain-containing protein [Alphaproteobacteria bacterium]
MRFVIIASVLIIAFLAIYGVLGFNIMMDRNEYLKQGYENKDYKQVFESIAIVTPEISEISYEGNSNAPLTIVIVHDFTSSESGEFYKEKIPELKSRYVDSGQARIYHKYIITRSEFENKEGRYNEIQAARCFNDLTDINSVAFHLDIISTGLDNAIANIGIYNIEREEFERCYNNKYYKSIYIDMIETEQFSILGPSIYLGINGKENIVMYGNPDIDEIYDSIRLKEIRVGLN